MLRYLRLFLITAFAFTAASAFAEEKITDFDVQIDVQTDGDFIITESISVISEGYQIRRGIFRDIPRFQQSGGYKIPQKFKVLSVTRNSEPEPYKTSRAGNAMRIRIGDKDVFLADGRHTYEITYLAKNVKNRIIKVESALVFT